MDDTDSLNGSGICEHEVFRNSIFGQLAVIVLDELGDNIPAEGFFVYGAKRGTLDCARDAFCNELDYRRKRALVVVDENESVLKSNNLYLVNVIDYLRRLIWE